MSLESGRFTVLHVSDVHATEGGLLYGAVDGPKRLEAVGEYARANGITPEAVVITGDLVQRGHPGAYPAVERACRRVEELTGAPVITVLGNHDDAEASRALPGHGHSHYGAVRIGEYRIIRLDSRTRELGGEQLGWLRRELAAPHGRGTILALHHAPCPSPMPVLQKQGLADAGALLEAIDGDEVLAILSGHFHHSLSATVAGTPVFVAPALAYHQVMDAGPGAVSGHDSPWFSLVQFSPLPPVAAGAPGAAPGIAITSTPIEMRPRSAIFTQPATG